MSLQEDYVKVTPATLNSSVSSISNYISSFEKSYKELLAEVKSSRQWEGTDAQVYIKQVSGFEDDLEKMVKLLRRYEDVLSSSVTSYVDCQDYLYEMGRNL